MIHHTYTIMCDSDTEDCPTVLTDLDHLDQAHGWTLPGDGTAYCPQHAPEAA